MESDLKRKAISSMLWGGVEKCGTLGMVLISNIILARLLLPEDFGCIAMLNVFIALANSLVHGGFGSALIQKKFPTHIDYTSVFWTNFVISVVTYAILFFLSPVIANFYKIPLLIKVLRIQSLSIIISSFTCVQLAILKRKFDFKSLAKRNIMASLIGLLCGIVMAYCGLGIWSLVGHVLISSFVGVFLLWRISSWRPTFEFSFSSIKELFSFGGLMMLSSVVTTIYSNIQSLVIGRFYSSLELGLVNQAQKLESVPSSALTSIVTEVSFPLFSKLQDDKNVVKYGLLKNIQTIEYLNIPLMVLFIVVAQPLITLCYGEKWIEAIPFFQILCVSSIIGIVGSLNMNVVASQGNSKMYFFIQLFRCLLSIGLITLLCRQGIYFLLWTLSIIPYIEFLLLTFLNKKLINCGLSSQLRMILPSFFVSVIVGVGTFFVGIFIVSMNIFVVLLIQSVFFLFFYVLLSRLFKLDAYYFFVEYLKENVFKSK